MNFKKPALSLLLIASLCLNVLVLPFLPASIVSAALPLVDDFESGLPTGTDPNGLAVGFVTFNDPNSTVAISTTTAPPAPLPGAGNPNNVLQMDVSVVSYAGFVHNFESGNAWVTQDWSAYEGISFWLYGNNSGTTLFVDVLDNRNPGSTKDDAERWSIDLPDNFSGWREIQIPFASMHRKEIGNGAPNDGFGLYEVHGWALGAVTTPTPQTYFVDNVTLYGTAPERPLTVGFSAINFDVTEGNTATVTAKLSKPAAEPVTVDYATGELGNAVAGRDYTPVSGTLTFAPGVTQQSFTVPTFDDAKYDGGRGVLVELSNPTVAVLGIPPVARVSIMDNESYDPDLLDDFETFPYLWRADKKITLTNPEIAAGDALALPGQDAYEHVLKLEQKNGNGAYTFGRTFPTGQDWSGSDGVSFWYYGQNNGKRTEVSLTNATRPAAANPSQWALVWSDEFNAKAGTAPNTAIWGRELGDGTANGIAGWGNSELEYYTDGTKNAATDGKGSLAITVREADGSLQCYYGPCQYTSARLLTKNRFEVAYGRVEARVKVPSGAGLWPAFWMLGTDIDQNPWPQSGEIDIMEYVARQPNQVFGTLHGPGYSGGQSYGKVYELGEPVANKFHTYAVEWQPDLIVWYIDGIEYFRATPDDPFLQGKEWVFNHPFFILLNVAVGGNFGGPVGEDTVFPATTLFDYVRVYQAEAVPTTFKATFTDNFTGWKQITLPFSAFTALEPGTTLDTSAVEAITFKIPGGTRKPVMIDQLRLLCPATLTVTSSADSGDGSLRNALNGVCAGGTVNFDPSLAGQTISLTSGPVVVGKNVTIDGSGAPGLALSGGGANRVLEVGTGVTATVSHLTMRDGYGWQVGGAVINNGSLTLDHVTVTNNTQATDAGDFWQGGGGIYNGDGATLNLVDSTVSNNNARWSGGAVYGFFNTTINITRSTLSGNISNDVGGAIRSLGNTTITNSTLSGNTSTGWHGGAIFHTDGAMVILNSTITDNTAPDYAASAIFVGSFNAAVPSFVMTNSIVTGNRNYACDHFNGASNFSSGGGNVVQDATCTPVATDQVIADAMLGTLADNGGPTLTHALLPGSAAIDKAVASACPAVDQRGVTRPQGAGCDVGAVEVE